MRVRCLRGRGDAHERGALLMSVLSVLSRSRCRVAWTTEPSFGAGVSFTISSRAGIADADFLVLPPSAASNSLSVFSCIVCVLQSCLHRRGFRRGAVRARESFRCWKLTAGVIRIAIRKVIFGGRLTSSSTA
ncbi:unnamed protein product [Prorocentrum cordatum]|uniref:Secreted protein n=1 Tax=Prorocentrum cordatum TaxID=2364126 RepID=A0ABN9XY34_9DINO|nr:unnamed protein product [Polarella glacialis]